MNTNTTKTVTEQTIGTAPARRVEEYVKPAELCDTQRRNMAYDAFAALQSRGF